MRSIVCIGLILLGQVCSHHVDTRNGVQDRALESDEARQLLTNFTEGVFARPVPDVTLGTTNYSNYLFTDYSYTFIVQNKPIPLPYWNATINGLKSHLTFITKNTSLVIEPIQSEGKPKSFCFKPKPLSGENNSTLLESHQCLYMHTSSLNHTVNISVSYSETLQEEYCYDAIEYQPLEMHYEELLEVVEALDLASGSPLEVSFEMIHPLFRTTEVFASGCLTFNSLGCELVEPRIPIPLGYRLQ